MGFYKYPSGNHMAVCKECTIARVADYAARNREKRLAYFRAYNSKPERRVKLADRHKTEAGKETKRIWYRWKKICQSNGFHAEA
jgi:hypothetical protein